MKKVLIGLFAALAFSGTAMAQTVIQVSTWGGPNHGVNTIVWPTWKQWIEEATEGRVTLRVNHDMGPPPAQMELIADGVADASWIFHGHMAGRFQLTQLPEFPTFEEFTSEAAAAAYWRTHQEYLAEANEHRGVVVVGVGMHGPGQLFSSREIDSLGDVRGQRMRIGGGVMNQVAEKLGIAGVALPPTGVYEAASQGVVEGAMLTLEALRSFRLAEVTPNVLTVPGGFYRGSFAIVVNPDTWSAISEDDRNAIMEVSGERLSRLFGYMMDVHDERGVAFGEEQGVVFNTVSDDELARLRELTRDLPEEWVNTAASGRGVDGEAALRHFRDQLEQAAAEPSIGPDTVEVRP
ncbi:MAG: TRAP transporter substrate-binding protein [Ectothiorhodospiraceae bacterium]|nr:TRAP transporter substrate-binding protein [Ectothiorhodospiraceae bacterium]